MHTGVGFYGKYAADGGSSNVHLSDFAIEGDVRERIDTDQVNGIGGALSDSTIDGLYIHHTKVGIWLDGPMNNLTITNTVIADQIADGINFHTGVTNSTVDNSHPQHRRRRARHVVGDVTAAAIEDANNVFDHNTVQTPVLANGIALYGGSDNTVSNNLVADPIREGSGLQAGPRFGSTPFAGHLRITNNTTVRAGTFELNWNIGLGAIWIYALEGSIDADIEVIGDNFLDNTYNAIMIVSRLPGEGPVLDHERALQGHPRRRHGHVGAERPLGRKRDVRERRRSQRRRRRHQQLRLVPLHAGRLGVHA